jgi:multidrug efflux pump subunit AcrA (membrane-fusion protein)
MARRPALTTVAIAALAAAAVVGAVIAVGSPATSSAQERTVTVARGVIQSTVSGSGNLAPANQVDVDFATSGEITHVYVRAGQHVAQDELLAKIDPDAADVELAQAKASLQSAQDTLEQAQEAAASASATTATTAQSNESTSASGNSGSGSSSGSATSTMTLAAAQANVDSAQLSVTSAEKALAATTLRAPMAGTVTVVNGSVGTTVSGGGSSSSSSSSSSDSSGASVSGGLGAASTGSTGSSSSTSSAFITLAQISRYKMDVSLSESDIGSVKVGQPATVTVNASSGEQFAARVTDIGVLSSSSSSSGASSSAVSYPVTLSLDQTGKGLKAGMSATADIVTSQVTGLALPSQALAGSTVTVEAADGSQTTQRVQTGVVGDSTTQVVSGLKVGDKVVVRSAAAALGAAAGGSDQLNSAIRSRLGAGGVGGGLGGGGLAGGGFAGAGGGGLRGAGGGGGRTP